MFDHYQPEKNFDEIFGANGEVTPHYARFRNVFQSLRTEEFVQKQQSIDLAFLRQGVTFNVYGNSRGAERVFPFDLVPRIIPATEWEFIERGLTQRITALNLFLHDVYHEQKIVKNGLIPAHYILSAKHFRRELVSFRALARSAPRLASQHQRFFSAHQGKFSSSYRVGLRDHFA